MRKLLHRKRRTFIRKKKKYEACWRQNWKELKIGTKNKHAQGRQATKSRSKTEAVPPHHWVGRNITVGWWAKRREIANERAVIEAWRSWSHALWKGAAWRPTATRTVNVMASGKIIIIKLERRFGIFLPWTRSSHNWISEPFWAWETLSVVSAAVALSVWIGCNVIQTDSLKLRKCYFVFLLIEFKSAFDLAWLWRVRGKTRFGLAVHSSVLVWPRI